MRKSRKWALLAAVAVVLAGGASGVTRLNGAAAVAVVLGGGAWGFPRLNGAAPVIDPSKIAVVERGTMTRSVVATGKVEPITKVEIKSKANGIIERLLVEVDEVVGAGRVLAELAKENITAR